MSDSSKDETRQEETLPPKEAAKSTGYFWLQTAMVTLVCVLLVFTFLGQAISVVGSSMVPTLHEGDMMIVRRIGYSPKNGDIVVLTQKGFMDEPIVKRVIAVGGQSVYIDYVASRVYVDGQPLDEPYINEVMLPPSSATMTISELTVPEGCLFVMGDNRNASTDSRDTRVGLVREGSLLGKVEFVLPLSHLRQT